MTRFLFSTLLALLPFFAVQAVEVDVYSGEVAVSGQSAGERRQALPAALESALQKLTGLRSFDDHPQVEPALGVASSILVSFHYRNAERLLPDGATQEELRLVASFAASEVDELVKQLQLPLWPADRKPTEVWLVVDNGMNRRIMPVEFEYVKDSMNDAAAGRGMPLTWPQADEEGQYLVDMQLLWGGYTEDLASPNGDGVMILSARREGLEWSVRSNLGFEGDNWAWRIRDVDLQAALTEAMQLAADQVAAVKSIAATDLGAWRYELTVNGLGNALDYERCLAYLQDIAVVERIAVVAARPGTVTFHLELNALPRYLEEALASGSVLEPDEKQDQYLFTGGARRGG